jgi:predicted metalloendopeptidase
MAADQLEQHVVVCSGRTSCGFDRKENARVRGGAPQNMDAFHEAFAIKPGDGRYLPPEQRIKFW